MLTVVPGSGSFYKLVGLPSRATNWIRYDIPNECRYYEPEDNSGYWHVHEDYLIGAIELSYKQQGAVDYSRVPVNLQIEIARAKEEWVYTKAKTNSMSSFSLADAYGRLHLLPSAPKQVVTAVWRALANTHHPDKGGDADKFREYSEAYELIKKEGK